MEEEYYKLYLGKNFLDTTPKPQLTIKKKKKKCNWYGEWGEGKKAYKMID